MPSKTSLESIQTSNYDQKTKDSLTTYFDQRRSNRPFIEKTETCYSQQRLESVYTSRCHSCAKFSLWLNEQIIHPADTQHIICNEDLPDNIKPDFEEASRIVSISPRGAAALLRLCVQKLCNFLDAKGNTIDQQIADLVTRGLNPQVSDMLDVVRVIGAESVHPGTMDMKDDVETAHKLFELINLVVERMISEPKKIEALKQKLPPSKLQAIEDRNARIKALIAPDSAIGEERK